MAKSAWAKIDNNWKRWFLQGGILNLPVGDEETAPQPTFMTNIGIGVSSSSVSAAAVQPDGKIILAGSWVTFNGLSFPHLVRINPDGTLDSTFMTNIGTGPGNGLSAIAIQPDGKIILGGALTQFNGSAAPRIVRLNSDGTIDAAFTTNNGTGFSSNVFAIAIQTDGKIVVGGLFTSFNGGSDQRIARLNSDGTRDAAFGTNIGAGFAGSAAQVNSIAIQSDGKIVVGGTFTTFNAVTVNRIARLNSNGTRDTAFTTNTGTAAGVATVNSVVIQSDGKILLGGTFISFNGTAVGRIIRLNSDGTRDAAFTTNNGTGSNGTVFSIAIQSDGKILIGGSFSSFNGATLGGILRLNSNGTMETSFNTNLGTGTTGTVQAIAIQSNGNIILAGFFTSFSQSTVGRVVQISPTGTIEKPPGASGFIRSIAIQPDGKILVGGAFTFFNGVTVNNIVRFNSNWTRDTTFTTNNGTGANGEVRAIAIQSDGKILVGGSFTTFNGITVNRIVRLNSSGSIDANFTTNTGTGANNMVNAIAIQSDGKILVGGDFTNFNGATVGGSGAIMRLNSDGTRDTAFTTNGTTNGGNGVDNDVDSLAIQPDGKIVIGGTFSKFNTIPANSVTRLNSDGTLDTAFAANAGTGASGEVRSIVIQPGGKIIIGGIFSTFNDIVVNRIARLNSDGTLDSTFTTNTGTAASGPINSLRIQSDGKIVVGGTFATFNNVTVRGIVRLNLDGSLDKTFNTNTSTGTGINVGSTTSEGVLAAALQSNGNIILVGAFTTFSGKNRFRIASISGEITA